MKSGNTDDIDHQYKMRKKNSAYRKVELRTWSDQKFMALSPMPPSGQTLFLYLLAGPFTRNTPIPGVVRAGRMAMAEALHWSQDDFDACFAEITAQKMVVADWHSQLAWLPNGIEHNSPESPNVIRSWRYEWDMIPDCPLKERIYAALKIHVDKLGTSYAQAFAEAISTPSTTPSVSPSSTPSCTPSCTPSVRGSLSPSSSPSRSPSVIKNNSNNKNKNKTPKSKPVSATFVAEPRARESGEKTGKTAKNRVKSVHVKTGKPLPDKADDATGTPSVSPSSTPSVSPSRRGSRTPSVTPSPSPSQALLDMGAQTYPQAAGKASRRRKVEPDTAAAWAAYSEAYAVRYGVEPVRNASVNSQMAKFVKRVGIPEAPEIARHFLTNNARFYVQRGHLVGLLLADAEKLRTEWITHRQVSNGDAEQADRSMTNLNTFAPLIAEARAREEAEAREREVNHG
jgi:hypothetical protein